MNRPRPLVLIRGGGDLATGVAARLARSGLGVVVTEIAQPLTVRRLVAFSEAVYSGKVVIEGLLGRRVESAKEASLAVQKGEIPVLVDPLAESRHVLRPLALVDGRMRKRPPELGIDAAPLVIGLGPGFTAGVDCHAVVETKRGHRLGRVHWEGTAQSDTGMPEPVAGHSRGRVLRAPASGVFASQVQLGSHVSAGQVIAVIEGVPLLAPFDGVLRGLIHDGLQVKQGDKLGDVDPRLDPTTCREISDKALAVGGGVLEALLTRPELRAALGG